jgi:hypothetical protein
MFQSGQLQLVVLESLWRAQLLPAQDLDQLRREYPPTIDDPDDDDPDYLFNDVLARHLLARPLPEELLARVERVTPSDDLERALYPLWDGEDEVFDIVNLGGIERCTALTDLELDHCDLADLSPLAGLRNLRRLRLDGSVKITSLQALRGLAALEELSLRNTHLTSLAALANFPKLRKVELSWGWEARRTAGLVEKSREVLDALRARKVKLRIDWPADAKPPKPPKPPKLREGPPPITPSSDPKQEAKIAANLDDTRALRAYATWLRDHGDPRGDLALNPAARTSLLKMHAAYLLGPFATHPFKGVVGMSWRDGWIRAAKMPCMSTGADEGDVLEALLALPTARFLEELQVEGHGWKDGALAEYLADAKPLPPLRVLRLGARGVDPSPQDLGNLGKVLARMPHLRELYLCGEAKLAGIDLPRAVELTALSWSMPRAMAAAVLGAKWPALERLRLDFGLGFSSISGTSFRPLLDGKQFPRLRHLGLRNFPGGAAFAKALVGSPLLRRLETLDLRDCDVDPAHARALRTQVKLKV